MLSKSCASQKTVPSYPSTPTASSSATAVHRNDLLVIATCGKVYCLDKRRKGAQVWRAKPDTPDVLHLIMASVFITDQDKVIVTGNGKTMALDLYTGRLLWTHKMKGWSHERTGAICTPSRILPIEVTPQPPGYDGEDPSKPMVISCTNKKVMAFDAGTGEAMWLFHCPNGGGTPCALLDPPTQYHRTPVVYVGCGSWLYCLHARTGHLEWSTAVSKSILACISAISIATSWSSRLAAETHTPLSQFPFDPDDD